MLHNFCHAYFKETKQRLHNFCLSYFNEWMDSVAKRHYFGVHDNKTFISKFSLCRILCWNRKLGYNNNNITYHVINVLMDWSETEEVMHQRTLKVGQKKLPRISMIETFVSPWLHEKNLNFSLNWPAVIQKVSKNRLI